MHSVLSQRPAFIVPSRAIGIDMNAVIGLVKNCLHTCQVLFHWVCSFLGHFFFKIKIDDGFIE